MNMNSDQPDFAPLRRLLKLKRYEQPPPRYFNEFSGLVISRIRAGGRDRSEDAMEDLALAAQWWRRLVTAFQNGPVLAGTSAAAVCGLLVMGAIYTESSDTGPQGVGFNGFQPQEVATTPAVFGTVSPLGFGQTNSDSLSGVLFDIPSLKNREPASLRR